MTVSITGDSEGQVAVVAGSKTNNKEVAPGEVASEELERIDPAELALRKDLEEKVNFLFEHFRKPNLDRFTYKEVEEGTKGSVHASWISRLATGKAQRPGLMVLKALTDFFKVDPSFWFNPLTEESKFMLKEKQGDKTISTIALRSSNLSPENAQVVLDLINSLERVKKDKQ